MENITLSLRTRKQWEDTLGRLKSTTEYPAILEYNLNENKICY